MNNVARSRFARPGDNIPDFPSVRSKNRGWTLLAVVVLTLWTFKLAPHRTASVETVDVVTRYQPVDSFRPAMDKFESATASAIPERFEADADLAQQATYLGSAGGNHPCLKPRAKILIVRGILTIFSLGMDDLGQKLEQRGYQVQVTTAASSYYTAEKMAHQIRSGSDNAPLIIIGHSLGGDLAPKLAGTFRNQQIPVDLLIMLDSTMPSKPPENVRRCVNLYQSNYSPTWARVFRGTDIEKQSQQTQLYNIDIRKLAGQQKTAGINHFNIDANPWIHDLIIDAVEKCTPSQANSIPTHRPIEVRLQSPAGQANGTPNQIYRAGPPQTQGQFRTPQQPKHIRRR